MKGRGVESSNKYFKEEAVARERDFFVLFFLLLFPLLFQRVLYYSTQK